jgi:DNA modification methylase/superfamily II DNA or RNA helicase
LKSYKQFIESKQVFLEDSGLKKIPKLNSMLYDFQRDIVAWALRKGRAALFCDCGLGKTPMQLEWAKHVPGPVLILAPLAVAQQTVREGNKFGIDVRYERSLSELFDETVTNYEMLERFPADKYAGVVLDESSILKSYDGFFRNQIISSFAKTPFRLACTATPAPNDYMELGNHCEFLGALTRTEMLSTFFVHDGGDTSKWRLKRHAQRDFWRWVCSWAVMIRKPSDLGYEDKRFILPALNIEDIAVEVDKPDDGMLFAMPALTLEERRHARSGSVEERAAKVAEIVARKPKESWLIWCNLNSESEAACALIPGAVEVRGSDTREEKESRMLRFSSGDIKKLVTKPSICGFGMNWQHCNNVVFLGLSDSYEQFYQAVRRCWRFGQTQPVDCYIVTSSQEGAVTENIKRKERDASKMAEEMVNNMHELNQKEVRGVKTREKRSVQLRTDAGEKWTMHLGDCVEVVAKFPENSVDYSIFSPPFASLYTYSALPNDMGNCRTHAEFYEHFSFLTKHLLRVLKPGRNLSFHCMNLPISKERDGYIGIADFRGDLIRIFQEAGFIYHSEVCIWKDPVTAMQRTKALGLLHKQLKKDSCMSRQGIADYLVTMRKPGDNPERVHHTNESFPVDVWQQYASPVWMDIDPSNTLQRESAREHDDERHICPLQLEVIRRGIRLWTNPNDEILSPFAGIGSEGYVAVQEGRRFIGVELKESYFQQATANLHTAHRVSNSMFTEANSEIVDEDDEIAKAVAGD